MLGAAVAFIGAQTPGASPWLGVVPVAVVAFWGLRRPLRRWRVARRGLSAADRAWLDAHIPMYQVLEGAARARFERDVAFMLDEQTFEGVAGVEADRELRLAVTAGAALLLHGRPEWEMKGPHTFLFYPDRFDDEYHGGAEAEFDGMAHEQGPVILSQKAVQESWTRPDDGSNVVLHELAHLIDFEQSGAIGVPSMLERSSGAAWQTLVRREMRKIRLGRSLLRPYAATNEAEFFAVAVENFFERPDLLERRHRKLFQALVAIFHLDPRTGALDATPEQEEAASEAIT